MPVPEVLLLPGTHPILISGPWNNGATGMCLVQFYTLDTLSRMYTVGMNVQGSMICGFQAGPVLDIEWNPLSLKR